MRWGHQAANPGVHRLSMTHSARQRNMMMHAQCPLPVYYSQDIQSDCKQFISTIMECATSDALYLGLGSVRRPSVSAHGSPQPHYNKPYFCNRGRLMQNSAISLLNNLYKHLSHNLLHWVISLDIVVSQQRYQRRYSGKMSYDAYYTWRVVAAFSLLIFPFQIFPRECGGKDVITKVGQRLF